MDDIGDEGQDFSQALLEAVDTTTDPFLIDDVPTKRRKMGGKGPQQKDFIDDLDSFSTVTSSKSKLNGSSFKNMGTVCSGYSNGRLRCDSYKSNCEKRVQKSDSYSAEINSTHYGWP
jgi:hypothetical protein